MTVSAVFILFVQHAGKINLHAESMPAIGAGEKIVQRQTQSN